MRGEKVYSAVVLGVEHHSSFVLDLGPIPNAISMQNLSGLITLHGNRNRTD